MYCQSINLFLQMSFLDSLDFSPEPIRINIYLCEEIDKILIITSKSVYNDSKTKYFN